MAQGRGARAAGMARRVGSGRRPFALGQRGDVEVFRKWAQFVARLTEKLNGGATARALFAHGDHGPAHPVDYGVLLSRVLRMQAISSRQMRTRSLDTANPENTVIRLASRV